MNSLRYIKMDRPASEEEDATRPMTIRAIVSEKLYDDTPTVKIYAAVLSTSKHISKIVKSLGDILPIPSLKHLKRVKTHDGKAYVVLDLVPETTEDECPAKRPKIDGTAYLEELKEKGFAYDEWGVEDVEVFEVPEFGPSSRLQYEKAMKYWPVNFHPEKKLETMLSERVFEESEQEHHLACMRYVLGRSRREGKDVALVVDFAAREFLAAGTDRVEDHPLQHAVMVAVDAVARLQGGGAWDLPFASLTFTGEPPRNRSEEAPYLCTGYDLYVSREPCVMCAMSLVHSRIRRVFFHARDPEKGALVSRCKIHTIKDLNHHYEVYEMVRE